MEYLVNQTRQIAITAESQEEALKKVLNGEGTVAAINMSANVRPQAPVRATMPTTIPAVTAK